MNRSVKPLSAARQGVAVLLLAHVLAVIVLAASPRLHHWVHPDADDDDHDCAVTWFLHGGGDKAPGPVVLPTFAGPVAAFVVFFPATAFVPSIFAANHVLEHAPPLQD